MGATSSRFLTKNIESLIGLGVPEPDIMALVPGGQAALDNPVKRFDGNTLIDIFNTAEKLMRDPAIGFRCGLNHGHVTYNDLAYTILFCANLRESFDISARFEPLAQQVGVNQLLFEGDEAHIIWKTHEDDPDRFRHFTDLSFATLARMGVWIKAVHGLSVKNMQLRHNDQRYRDQYANMFDCPIEYGAKLDVLTFDKAFLNITLPGHNPPMLKRLIAKLERDLSQLDQTLLERETVRAYLDKILGIEPPTIKHIAGLMDMPEWKLRRRLKEQGTSFRKILENVRRQRYEILIEEPMMSQVQIAGQLGYSEQSAFSRAYKTWYGLPPSQIGKATGVN